MKLEHCKQSHTYTHSEHLQKNVNVVFTLCVNHFYVYYESTAGIMKYFQLEFKQYSSIVQPVFVLIVIFLN